MISELLDSSASVEKSAISRVTRKNKEDSLNICGK